MARKLGDPTLRADNGISGVYYHPEGTVSGTDTWAETHEHLGIRCGNSPMSFMSDSMPCTPVNAFVEIGRHDLRPGHEELSLRSPRVVPHSFPHRVASS
jgi:hypothetical protein